MTQGCYARLMKPLITERTAIVRILLAALLIALAGPAMAKKQGSGEAASAQQQVTIKPSVRR
jgi:hypothetical protein